MYEQDSLNALDAIIEAQRVTFAPVLFQIASCLRSAGVLTWLGKQGKRGATLDEITENSTIDEYAANILPDMGLGGRITVHKEGRYYLAKVGRFLLHDTMTRVNMDSTQDVCYQRSFYLENASKDGRSAGPEIFSDWPTIYPALLQLPLAAHKSWFASDHYYSNGAFDTALPYAFASIPATLYDIGRNTGRWVLHYCQHDDNITVIPLNLPQRITLTRENMENARLSHRINSHVAGMFSNSPSPGGADIWWMS